VSHRRLDRLFSLVLAAVSVACGSSDEVPSPGTLTSGGAATGGAGGGDATPVSLHGNRGVSGTEPIAEALVWMREPRSLTVFRAAMGAEQAGNAPGYTTSAEAPLDGGSDSRLNGHGSYVVARLRD